MLRARVSGEGPDLVLLHGWALNGGVWQQTARTLSTHYRVTLLDLPGHGHSAGLPEGGYTLPRLAEAVAAALPARCVLAGWSLGGMVALELALDFPARLERLVLIDSTPRFVADADWPDALGHAVLDGFAERLRQDYRATVGRFLALQVLNAEGARDTLASLRERMAEAPPPDPRALEGGLDILRHASLVPRLRELRVPLTIIHGARDTLVPVAAARALAARLPGSALHVIEGAGHAPFLSHPLSFEAIIEALPRA
jgi:pimeloyl-[acyl-carrier protein] methyl ester esterase